jgi:hypothetical protein
MQYFSHSTHSKYRGNSNIRHLKYSGAEFVSNKLPCSLCMGYVSMGYTTFGSSFLDAALIINVSSSKRIFIRCATNTVSSSPPSRRKLHATKITCRTNCVRALKYDNCIKPRRRRQGRATSMLLVWSLLITLSKALMGQREALNA